VIALIVLVLAGFMYAGEHPACLNTATSEYVHAQCARPVTAARVARVVEGVER
jgi:hypothetical protein